MILSYAIMPHHNILIIACPSKMLHLNKDSSPRSISQKRMLQQQQTICIMFLKNGCVASHSYDILSKIVTPMCSKEYFETALLNIFFKKQNTVYWKSI